MKRIRTFSAALFLGGFLVCAAPGLARPAPSFARPKASPNAAPRSGAYTPPKTRLRPAPDRIDQAVNRLLVKADEFWHAGDYEAVAGMYYIITDLDPTYLEGWQNYGWLLWAGLQRDDAAMRVFQRGLAYHPRTWELYFEIAYLHQHRGEYATAAQWLAKATRYNAPRYVWHARAHALEYAGLIDKSKAMWKTIIAKFPNDPPAPANLKRLEEGRIRTRPALGIHETGKPLPKRTPDSIPDTEITGPVDPDSI